MCTYVITQKNPLPHVKEKHCLTVVKVVKKDFIQELLQPRKKDFSIELGSPPNIA